MDVNPTDDRAQTVLDFAIAMGIFLLALAFVFSFVPSLTAPFVDGDQEMSAASDRTASHLAEGALADVNETHVVREPCLSAFFENDTAPDECGFTGDDTRTHLGISDRIHVEVELVRRENSEEQVLCLDEEDMVTHEGTGDCDGLYFNVSTGGSSTGQSTTVTRRTVTVASEDCAFADTAAGEACDTTLYVRMW